MQSQLTEQAKALWANLFGIRINAILDGKPDAIITRAKRIEVKAWVRFQRRKGTNVVKYREQRG